MVSAELAPHAAETPAGDAVFSLSKALKQLGHEVTVAVPRYAGFETSGLLLARRLTGLSLATGGEVALLDGQLSSGVKLVLFDAPVLFERSGIYAEDGEEYSDNSKRFGLLSEASVALIRQRREQGKSFDLVHLHDWPAALVSVMLRELPGPTLPSILTIHDAERQGILPKSEWSALGLPSEISAEDNFIVDHKINVLVGTVGFADATITVSTTLAQQIAREQTAIALGRALRKADVQLEVVQNGIDYAIYNPATDAALDSRYDAEDVANKGRSKTALLRDLGLDLDPERPLLVNIGSPDATAGMQVLLRALPHLMKSSLSLVVAGAGDVTLEKKFEEASARYAESLRYLKQPTDPTMRRLLAAADFSLIIRAHEVGGESVLKAQRYGTVPIAYMTCGAADRIVDCDAQLETGTGFLFEALTPSEIVAAVQRGLAAFVTAPWPNLRRRIMRLDASWDRPARRYLQVYRRCLAAQG